MEYKAIGACATHGKDKPTQMSCHSEGIFLKSKPLLGNKKDSYE